MAKIGGAQSLLQKYPDETSGWPVNKVILIDFLTKDKNESHDFHSDEEDDSDRPGARVVLQHTWRSQLVTDILHLIDRAQDHQAPPASDKQGVLLSKEKAKKLQQHRELRALYDKAAVNAAAEADKHASEQSGDCIPVSTTARLCASTGRLSVHELFLLYDSVCLLSCSALCQQRIQRCGGQGERGQFRTPLALSELAELTWYIQFVVPLFPVRSPASTGMRTREIESVPHTALPVIEQLLSSLDVVLSFFFPV
jgi:hypothetical protein